MSGATPQRVSGYSRASVDDFCAAARLEQTTLERTVADARSRARRARTAVGAHHVMVGMLLETQRDLAELRRSAEAEIAQLMRAAEKTARALVRAAYEESGADPTRVPPAGTVTGSSFEIDVAALEREEHALDERSRAESSAESSPSASIESPVSAQADDPFFAYLRGALADERPLGPRFE